jgi:hypothetical protein
VYHLSMLQWKEWCWLWSTRNSSPSHLSWGWAKSPGFGCRGVCCQS